MTLNKKRLDFLSSRHNTKVGTWGEINLIEGSANFELLDDENKARISESVETNIPFVVPPAVWHRLITSTEDVQGYINFYCHPIYFFQKKYQLTKPHSDVVRLDELYLKTLFNHKKVLDVYDMGCGRGRNSLYLSQLGYQISCADINEDRIEILKNIIEKENINNIKPECINLEKLTINKNYDVILLNVVLQFLNKDKVLGIINSAQEHTNIGGLHSIVCPVETDGVTWPKHFSFTLKPNQLQEFYLDKSWAIIEYNEDFGNLHVLDEKGLPIRGKFASMVARKIF
ncbi:MAG: tellurite methyltransferase [Francisellaceae bacterium]|jgi:tellurite methyltransferase